MNKSSCVSNETKHMFENWHITQTVQTPRTCASCATFVEIIKKLNHDPWNARIKASILLIVAIQE